MSIYPRNARNNQVYTWGCNDDGAVGRDGDEAVPMLVPDIRYVCIHDVFDPGR